MLIATAQERLDAVQDILRSQVSRTVEVPEKNEQAVRSLDLAEVFEYPLGSGIYYRVPPVSYLRGLEIRRLTRDIRATTQERSDDEPVLQRLEQLHRQASDLLRSMVQPVSFWRRLAWRWAGNPFQGLTEMELGQILLFFYALTTRSRLGFYSPSMEQVLQPSLRDR